MRNSSLSDRSFVMESDDDEDAVEAGRQDGSDEEESDGSSSCGSPRGPAAAGHPSSYSSHQWPQSYRYVARCRMLSLSTTCKHFWTVLVRQGFSGSTVHTDMIHRTNILLGFYKNYCI
jgi:hypothetical protein